MLIVGCSLRAFLSGNGPVGKQPATSFVLMPRVHRAHQSAPFLRMVIEPTDRKGLKNASRLMIDKVTTMPKSQGTQR